MSRKKGLMITCDRCGEWTFREHAGVDSQNVCNVLSLSYSEVPNDWRNVSGVGDLCPKCAEDYRMLLLRFNRKPAQVREG